MSSNVVEDSVYEFKDELSPAVVSRAIEDYHQFQTAGFIMLFQLGYFLFEFGSIRKKNSQTILIKTFVIFIFACFATYTFGYAFAYGKNYFIGTTYYFTSFTKADNPSEKNEIKWSLFMLTASMTAQLACSGLVERTKMLVPICFSILVTVIIFPFVVGWTLGDGFMSKLGLVDFSGCAAIHLVAGFCSLFASLTVKTRLGRFEPLAIKKTVGNNEIYLSHVQKEYVQNKINQIAKEMPFTRDKSLESQVQRARKLLKRLDSDNFYGMNNELCNFIGTLIMWFSLCHIYSGYNLTVYRQRYQVELAYVNCLLAGGAGGITALGFKALLDLKYKGKSSNGKNKLKPAYDFSTQIANPLSRYDIFIIGRGIIAGCVMVSAPAVNYKLWISLIVGAFGGLVQIGTSVILKKFKIDEPLQIFQTHGVPALLSLILIVCFDSSTGIFFTDFSQIGTQDNLLKIIQIFGANVLGCLIVIGWCAVFTIPFLMIIKYCCLRASKVSELIGLDVDQLILGNTEIENFVQFVVTEYYPENSGDYLRKKRRLLEQAKKNKKGAKAQMTKEELFKIKELLDEQIREGLKTEQNLLENDLPPFLGENSNNFNSNNLLNPNIIIEGYVDDQKPIREEYKSSFVRRQDHLTERGLNDPDMQTDRGFSSDQKPRIHEEVKRRQHKGSDIQDLMSSEPDQGESFTFENNGTGSTAQKQNNRGGTFAAVNRGNQDQYDDSDGSQTNEGEVSNSAEIEQSEEDGSSEGGHQSDERRNVGATNLVGTGVSKPAVGRVNNFALNHGVADLSRDISRIQDKSLQKGRKVEEESDHQTSFSSQLNQQNQGTFKSNLHSKKTSNTDKSTHDQQNPTQNTSPLKNLGTGIANMFKKQIF